MSDLAQRLPKITECPFCKRPSSEGEVINHVPGCDGLQNAGLIKLQLWMFQETIAQLRADAERYRWLREGSNDDKVISISKHEVLLRGNDLDAAIDAQIAKDAEGEK